jgi:hypothetical protein
MPFPVTPNSYEVRDSVALIDVGTNALPGLIATIDSSDLDLALDGLGRWFAYKTPGRANITVRRAVTVAPGQQGHQILKRLIYDTEETLVVMHMDHDGLNLRRSNLKAATHQELAAHARHSKAKRRGAFRTESGRWRAIIGVENEIIRLGTFDTEDAAGRAYDAAAREYFGAMARLNFPSLNDAIADKRRSLAGAGL